MSDEVRDLETGVSSDEDLIFHSRYDASIGDWKRFALTDESKNYSKCVVHAEGR